MKTIKIKCPAKINIDLKVINKRPDGFHNIESIMQTINLFDFLTIEAEISNSFEIKLCGNNNEIPYDERNLVYKAAKLFCERTNFNIIAEINIDKHIPVAAGLAGGSTDAAGTLYGLNKLFNFPLTQNQLHELCALLGSDLNACLQGGRILATGRGEKLKQLPYKEFNLSIIKPQDLGISAKEAYTKFSQKDKNSSERENFANDLEWAVIEDYTQLRHIKNKYPASVMTGSGSAFYIVGEIFENEKGFFIKNNLKTIPYGVTEQV